RDRGRSVCVVGAVRVEEVVFGNVELDRHALVSMRALTFALLRDGQRAPHAEKKDPDPGKRVEVEVSGRRQDDRLADDAMADLDHGASREQVTLQDAPEELARMRL